MTIAEVTTLSPERAALRARHVGASEVAALFGLHPYKTKFELWHEKAGNLPDDDLSGNDRVFWGVMLEQAIGQGIAAKTGWNLQKVQRYCRHATVVGMGASPDFEVIDHPKGRGTVQIKNVDGLVFREWEDGKAPMVYQLQVQHEIACGDYAWGALGVLVGGNRLEIFEYDRHPGAIARIEAAITEFWQSVHEGIEPKPDFQRDLEALQRLYSAADLGKILDLKDEEAFTDACARYVAAAADEKAATARKDSAKAEILTFLQDAAIAFADGFKVSSSNVDEKEISYVRKAYRTFSCKAVSSKKGKSK